MENYSSFLNDLKQLISFESVLATPKKDMPFGEGVYNALNWFLHKAQSFGFQTINYNNYIGEVVFGEGEEIGIIGHLDVVPVGGGWETDPFTLTEKDGYLYGRGIMDDKGPLLLCLYILKELKDSGKLPTKKFRLIVGCNEESGWQDVEYLATKSHFPKYGFSPDGNFPISYAEKGMAIVEFTIPKLKNFSLVSGGTVINAVCGEATAVPNEKGIDQTLLAKRNLTLKDGKIVAIGKSAHGSTPRLGINAIKLLFDYFLDMGEDVKDVIDCLFNDRENIFGMQNEQGTVTFSPDIITQDDQKIIIKCDCRFPYPFTFEDVKQKFDKFNIDYTYQIKHPTQYVEKEGDFVSTLLNAYNSVTKENATPLSQGGSTFARVFEKGCAFGPEFEGHDNAIHQPNEHVLIDDLLKMYQIYKNAIFALSK